jgi:hypothetical protein
LFLSNSAAKAASLQAFRQSLCAAVGDRLARLRRRTYDRHPIQPFEFGLGGHQYLNR